MQPRGSTLGVVLFFVLLLFVAGVTIYEAPWVSRAPAGPSQVPIVGRYELAQDDNGRTFTYPITSRFTVILDGAAYPMPPACVPAGVVGTISNVPAVPAPLAAARFEAVTPGTCVLTAGHWEATIVVTPESPTSGVAPDQGTAPYQSGISGQVTAGPSCPIVRSDTPCPDRPLQTVVTIYRARNPGQVYATVKTDTQGAYTISLPPGDYVATAGAGSTVPRCNPVSISVGPSGYARGNISCDTGIR